MQFLSLNDKRFIPAMEHSNESDVQILDMLNSEEKEKMIGGIVFVSVLMLFGIIGNIHIMYVFSRKINQSNHKTFILCLGMIDILACTVSMPTTLLDLTNPLTYYYTTVCKLARNVNYFVCWSSAFILLVVTVDRYRKICHPMDWQINNQTAKIICVVTLIFSLGLSIPAFFISGHRTIQTRHPNITGVQCSIDDEYLNTHYPTIYNIVLMTLAGILLVVYIVLYAMISRTIFNRGKGTSAVSNPEKKMAKRSKVSLVLLSVINIPYEGKNPVDSVSQVDSVMRNTSVTSLCSVEGFTNSSTRQHVYKFRETRRLTVIFFIIVAIYFCSYIPNIIIKLFTVAPYETFQHLEKNRAVLYNTFTWFFYVNNVANAVVYFFLDTKFRTEIQSFYCRSCR